MGVVVACPELEDKEVFEAGGGIVGIAAIGIALNGDVGCQGENIGFGIGPGCAIRLAHGKGSCGKMERTVSRGMAWGAKLGTVFFIQKLGKLRC